MRLLIDIGYEFKYKNGDWFELWVSDFPVKLTKGDYLDWQDFFNFKELKELIKETDYERLIDLEDSTTVEMVAIRRDGLGSIYQAVWLGLEKEKP
jgi:hypothetical protein